MKKKKKNLNLNLSHCCLPWKTFVGKFVFKTMEETKENSKMKA